MSRQDLYAAFFYAELLLLGKYYTCASKPCGGSHLNTKLVSPPLLHIFYAYTCGQPGGRYKLISDPQRQDKQNLESHPRGKNIYPPTHLLKSLISWSACWKLCVYGGKMIVPSRSGNRLQKFQYPEKCKKSPNFLDPPPPTLSTHTTRTTLTHNGASFQSALKTWKLKCPRGTKNSQQGPS